MDSADGLQAIDRDSLAEISRNVADTAQILLRAGSVTDTLTCVIDTAMATIDGCDFAGISLFGGSFVTSPAHTDPILIEVDALEHRTRQGPSLDATAHRQVFYVEDLTSDLRWPAFCPSAVALGIRSMLAMPLAAGIQSGALNLYARAPSAFGVIDRAKAAILVSLATLALSVAQSHEDEERHALAFERALHSREMIGEALGILMERERISADHAFDILRRASQHLNVKLREVAQHLVDTGEDPDTGLA
jgi:hypothetical protein